MNTKGCIAVVALTLTALTTLTAQAAKTPHRELIVETPETTPLLAEKHAEGMYLHTTEAGRTLLYVELAEGSRLDVLDVTDPEHIACVAETELAVPAAFDFVQNVGGDAVLVRLQNGAGVAELSLKQATRPRLSAVTLLGNLHQAEALGDAGLLMSSAPMPERAMRDYRLVDAASFTTIRGVTARVEKPDTGTLFLMNADGITMVRQLSAERNHQRELYEQQQD